MITRLMQIGLTVKFGIFLITISFGVIGLNSNVFGKTCTGGVVVSDFVACPEDGGDPELPPCIGNTERLTPNGSCIEKCGPGLTRSPSGGCVDSRGYEDCKGDEKCEEFQKSLVGISASKYGECVGKYGENYCNCKHTLKGIYLNTEVPFVGAKGNPRCLVLKDADKALPTVLQSLIKILMIFVMIGGFGVIVWGGVEIAADKLDSGKKKIMGVVIAFALLGGLGVILRLINPNFFS